MPWKYKKNLNNFMTAVADDTEGELWIYGDIVDDAWWDNEVSPISVRDTLDEMGCVSNLNIRVNSYGGSVYAGNAIINILDSYRRKTGAKINAYIEGIAASMGSGIPMVADKIYMAENAMYMLHKPYTIIIGNSADLQKEIEVLSKAEDTLVKNYMRHFNGSEDELRQMLHDETWLTADEAIEYGLCDEIIQAVEIAASARGSSFIINGEKFRGKAAKKIAAKFNIGSPMAMAEPNKIKNVKGEPELFVYDKNLSTYGITEDMFNGFGISAEAALSVAATVATAMKPAEPTHVDDFISKEMVKNALGKDMEAEAVLDLAKNGMNYDSDATSKAKEYDKIVNAAIDDAIANGIRAKGENFNEAKWKKILSNLDYSEILDQSKEWIEDAKIANHAGKRVSEPWKGTTDNKSDNFDAYKV